MNRGASVVYKDVAYFRGIDEKRSCQINAYEAKTDTWNTDIPECPYCMSSLVIVNGLLTTVGGRTRESAHSFSSFHPPFNYINKLYSLDVGKWNDNLPPMPTARSNPAVATCGHYIWWLQEDLVMENLFQVLNC